MTPSELDNAALMESLAKAAFDYTAGPLGNDAVNDDRDNSGNYGIPLGFEGPDDPMMREMPTLKLSAMADTKTAITIDNTRGGAKSDAGVMGRSELGRVEDGSAGAELSFFLKIGSSVKVQKGAHKDAIDTVVSCTFETS